MAILRMEVGKVLIYGTVDVVTGNNYYRTILFKNSYVNPVVIAFIMTYTGAEPTDVRVRNLTPNSCEIFMQEYDNDGHNDELVSYLVIEAGHYILPDGTKIEAGREIIPENAIHTSPSAAGTFDTVSLSFNHTFPTSPAFFTTLNTHNNNDYMSVLAMDVTTSGAEIFQIRETSEKIPSDESAGWLAIDTTASGVFPGGSVYETGSFSDGTDDGTNSATCIAHKVTYTYNYDEPPVVFSQIVTLNGTNGGNYGRINDNASGTFSDLWIDNSNINCYANYTSGRIKLYGHRWNSGGANLYSANRYPTQGEYTLEFDWWVSPSDNYLHLISFTIHGLTYVEYDASYGIPDDWGYYFILRDSRDNFIHAGETSWPFSYGSFHKVKFVVNFYTMTQSIYMDGNFIGSVSMLTGVLGNDLNLNFHWHCQSYSTSQYYDNIVMSHTYIGESAHARGAALTDDYFQTYAEETSNSTEVNHSDETFSHMVFDHPFDVIYVEETGTVITGERKNIWTVDPNVYKCTSLGLNVYSLSSEALINFVPFTDGANSVWANDQYVYIATSISGVYRCPVNTVTGVSAEFSSYKSYPDITNNYVNYIHGNNDYLCATTISGVDRYRFSDGQHRSETIDYPSKCYQAANGDYYYVVNSYFKVKELDGNVFGWKYSRKIEFSKTISEDNYQILIEIPLTQPDEIYIQAATAGADIRFIDDMGNVLNYFIEVWDDVYNEATPQIWVKLNKGTDIVYMLYGNVKAIAQSNPENTFMLYDHFEGTELPDLWSFSNGGTTNNTATVSNSLVTLHSTNNISLSLTSTRPFLGGILEYSFKAVSGGSSDLDWIAQFIDSGVYAYIGITSGAYETPHRLVSRTSQGNVQGVKLVSTSFKTHTLIESANYQMSDYSGETLTTSGVLNTGYRRIKLSFGNLTEETDIAVDWIRLRTYSPDIPTYTVGRGKTIKEFFDGTKLHAVYESGGGYIYSAETTNTVNSTYISDIYVTEGTSTHDNDNVIFLATTWGVTILEEKRGDEENCEKRIYLLST